MKTLAFALLLAAPSAFAQDAWPPPLPDLRSASAAVPTPPSGEALDPLVLDPGLGILIKTDVNGLGGEASRVDAWRASHAGARLAESAGAWTLAGADGARLPLSPAFGAALRSMNQYFGLTGPTLARPITREELKAAFLTPETAAAVRGIFDKVMAERLTVAGKVFLPEIGGEATLDGTLHFHFNADPNRGALRELVARRDDPAGLARLFQEQPEAMARIDAQGILKHHLGVRAKWDAENKIPVERRDWTLHSAVDSVAELAADHYSADYATQLQTMLKDEWSGRYAGPWHCHPPDLGPDGWVGDAPPSDADYEAASKAGQEIVIVFMSDGFDVYDLSDTEKEPPFRLATPFSYRAPDWRAHFQVFYDLAKKGS